LAGIRGDANATSAMGRLYVHVVAASRFGRAHASRKLASYLKDREAEGVKSVHVFFPNDLDASTQTTNHMVVDVAGFSSGVAAFTSRCEQAQ
jgi:hypothetical protein